MGDFKIELIDTSEGLNQWNEFVKESPHGTIFHETFWLNSVSKKFRVYGLFKGHELFAGLPVVTRERSGVKWAKIPTLTPWLGPSYRKSKAKYVTKISNHKKMDHEFASRLKEDFDHVKLRFPPSITDLQSYLWEGFSSDVRYTYRIDLTDLEEVWDAMEASRRNDIRKAKKDGVKVTVTDDFSTTLKLVKKTFNRQNKNPPSESLVRSLDETLEKEKRSKSFIATNSTGKPIATVYLVWDRRVSYYLLGGYDAEASHHGASALAMWKAIQYSKKELKLDAFDLEGSMVKQIEKFFRKFGGKITPYYSLKWQNQRAQYILGARRIAGKALKHLKLR